MILTKIILENFRQFYDTQEIVFSTDPDKNVTLVHAENGVGKTTLLNALLWCFYKKTTERFENKEGILSLQAKAEGISDLRVEVHFQHDDKVFAVSRGIKNGKDEFYAFEIIDGHHKPQDAPKLLVESAIPEEMSRHFFFDGEYAETLSRHGNKKEIKKALEKMLGCETAIQAIDDLKSIKREVGEEIRKLARGSEVEAYQKAKDKEEKDLKEIKDKISALEKDKEFQENIKRKLEEQLVGTEGAEAIQTKKNDAEKRLRELNTNKNNVKADLTRWINEYSIGLFAQKAISKYNKVEKDGKLKGHIPSKVSTKLIEEILGDKTCICGRSFGEHSHEAEEIQKLLKESGNPQMSDRLMGINKCIERLSIASEKSWSEFQKLDVQLKKADEEIDECELKIKECGKQLEQSNVSEIREKRAKAKECERNISKIDQELGKLNEKAETCLQAIKDNEKRISQYQSMNKLSQGVQTKDELLSKTIECLEDELKIYRGEARTVIADKVNDILSEIARRDYHAEINEEFDLDMFHSSFPDTPVAKSEGENQLLSLAFIASLVNFAASRREEKHHILKPGAMAPLMLDSPFGKLDENYRKSTAKFLPELSRQVILLVTKSQGDHEVISSIENRIGAEYVLISENKSSKHPDTPLDTIEIEGEEIECSIYNADKDMTTIRKVK